MKEGSILKGCQNLLIFSHPCGVHLNKCTRSGGLRFRFDLRLLSLNPSGCIPKIAFAPFWGKAQTISLR